MNGLIKSILPLHFSKVGDAAQAPRLFRFSVTVVICGLLCVPDIALAESLSLTCERESVTAAGWSKPLNIVYEGAESGTVVVTAENTQLSLAATYKTRAEDGAKVIDAFGETTAIMPDLTALDACTAADVPADFKDDADFYNVASLSCLGVIKAGSEPVSIDASVRVGILPTSDVIVEIKRTYLEPSSGPGGVMYIETYPANCKLDQ